MVRRKQHARAGWAPTPAEHQPHGRSSSCCCAAPACAERGRRRGLLVEDVRVLSREGAHSSRHGGSVDPARLRACGLLGERQSAQVEQRAHLRVLDAGQLVVEHGGSVARLAPGVRHEVQRRQHVRLLRHQLMKGVQLPPIPASRDLSTEVVDGGLQLGGLARGERRWCRCRRLLVLLLTGREGVAGVRGAAVLLVGFLLVSIVSAHESGGGHRRWAAAPDGCGRRLRELLSRALEGDRLRRHSLVGARQAEASRRVRHGCDSTAAPCCCAGGAAAVGVTPRSVWCESGPRVEALPVCSSAHGRKGESSAVSDGTRR